MKTATSILTVECDSRAMIVGALGDVHGEKFLNILKTQRKMEHLDLLLLAGDLTDSNDIEEFDLVVAELKRLTDAQMIGVFRNEEYDGSHPEYEKRADISFLDDEAMTVEKDGMKIKIVGTTGSLDRPTWWQRTNLPDIWRRYQLRIERVSRLLDRGDSDVLILLSHYAIKYETLVGEKEERYPEMGSRRFEPIILERSPDIVFHAHAHVGTRIASITREQRSLEDFGRETKKIPIYNVSQPLSRSRSYAWMSRERERGVTCPGNGVWLKRRILSSLFSIQRPRYPTEGSRRTEK
ncbi:MAG: metallophosphoesterase family protein [Methanomassiliicoccales archaeon]